MCDTITEFNFPKNIISNYLLFPSQLFQNDLLFYGTSVLHLESICNQGLIQGYMPFQNNELNDLINLLEHYELQTKEIENLKNTISDYVRRKTNEDEHGLDITMAYTPYEALYYATGLKKGGQIFTQINNALNLLDNRELTEQESNLTRELRQLIITYEESDGLVLAIEVNNLDLFENYLASNEHFRGIGFNAVKFIGQSIGVRDIIGRTTVANDINIVPEILKHFAEVNRRDLFQENEDSLIFRLAARS